LAERKQGSQRENKVASAKTRLSAGKQGCQRENKVGSAKIRLSAGKQGCQRKNKVSSGKTRSSAPKQGCQWEINVLRAREGYLGPGNVIRRESGLIGREQACSAGRKMNPQVGP
jgi:hypothetical protein